VQESFIRRYLMRVCSKDIATELLELTFGQSVYNGESM